MKNIIIAAILGLTLISTVQAKDKPTTAVEVKDVKVEAKPTEKAPEAVKTPEAKVEAPKADKPEAAKADAPKTEDKAKAKKKHTKKDAVPPAAPVK